jgi:outer membrane protein assembly factor BamB
MEREALAPGGEWPASWLPKPLGVLPVQSRSPIIPIDVGGANPVVYLGSQEGKVYAVDGAQGGAAVADPWDPVLPVPLGGFAGQAAPAGMFTAFGGSYDYLLVGTTSAPGVDNRFYAIDPITGAEIDYYDGVADTGKGFGPINGMATVDYASNRVYFASDIGPSGGNNTLWCLNLLPEPKPVFSLEWSGDFGTIYSSPVLMGGRIYVMEDIFLASVDAATGTFYDTNVNDGQVKEFIWPDWRNPGDIYFATTNCVWAFHDDGTLNEKFGGCISLPGGAIPTSGILMINQRLYVGADDGKLHEVDLSGASPSFKSVQLGHPGPAPPPPAVGSPSLDWPNSLIHVGTEAGVFYAVQVPLP